VFLLCSADPIIKHKCFLCKIIKDAYAYNLFLQTIVKNSSPEFSALVSYYTVKTFECLSLRVKIRFQRDIKYLLFNKQITAVNSYVDLLFLGLPLISIRSALGSSARKQLVNKK